MRRELILSLACAASLAGCSLMPDAPIPKDATPAAKVDPSLTSIGEHLDIMSRLLQASPAEQAEIFQRARYDAETAPTTTNVLRYALALACPDHGSTDPALARQTLSELLARPETMLPAERALAWVVLKDVEQRLVLQQENHKLNETQARLERERGVATNRRLQAEIEENTRLKKELAEAKAKLDEITRIERSIIERKPTGNGSKQP
jgi:hypothetical protein